MASRFAFHVIVLILLAHCATLHAQWCRGIEIPWKSSFTRDELLKIEEAIGATPEQVSTLESLFRDHVEAIGIVASVGQAREAELLKVQESLPKGTPEFSMAYRDRQKQLADFAEQQSRLDQMFITNIEVLLNDDQADEWVSYLRGRQWDLAKSLPGLAPGAKVNVAEVVASLTLDEAERLALQPMLADYADMVNVVLKAMIDNSIRSSRLKWVETERMIRNNRIVTEAIAQSAPVPSVKNLRRSSVLDRRAQLATQIAVAQVNDTFATAISQVLPPDVYEVFIERYRAARFPMAYPTSSRAHEFVRLVKMKHAVSEEQSLAIDAIVNDAMTEMAPINRAAADAQDVAFKAMWREYLSNPTGEDSWWRSIIPFESQRNEISAKAIARMRLILTAEQLQGLEDYDPLREYQYGATTTNPATQPSS